MKVDPRNDGQPVWKGLESLQSLESGLWLHNCPSLGKDDFAKLADFQNLVQLRIEGGRPVIDADLQHLTGASTQDRRTTSRQSLPADSSAA